MPNYEDILTSAFQDELVKIAYAKLATGPAQAAQAAKGGIKPIHKALGLMAAGGVAYETGRRANQDRRMGRAMRMQQGV